MRFWLPLAVSVLYAGAGLDEALRGRWTWAGVWFCYSAANVFLVLAAKT